MAYELLFSRNRTNDSPVTFGDVPVVGTSCMVDILSLAEAVRRVAGWIYPSIQSTTLSYEFSNGVAVVFGKNRIILPELPTDIFLTFYPRYGVKQYIISVYSGFPSAIVPPPEGVPIPGTTIRVYRASATGLIMASYAPGQSFVAIASIPSCQAALVRSDGTLWMAFQYPQFGYAWPPTFDLLPANADNYQFVSNESGTIAVPNV